MKWKIVMNSKYWLCHAIISYNQRWLQQYLWSFLPSVSTNSSKGVPIFKIIPKNISYILYTNQKQLIRTSSLGYSTSSIKSEN